MQLVGGSVQSEDNLKNEKNNSYIYLKEKLFSSKRIISHLFERKNLLQSFERKNYFLQKENIFIFWKKKPFLQKEKNYTFARKTNFFKKISYIRLEERFFFKRKVFICNKESAICSCNLKQSKTIMQHL